MPGSNQQSNTDPSAPPQALVINNGPSASAEQQRGAALESATDASVNEEKKAEVVKVKIPEDSVLAALIEINKQSPLPNDADIRKILSAAYAKNKTLGRAIVDQYGQTALHFALYHGFSTDILQWFFEEGRDPDLNYSPAYLPVLFVGKYTVQNEVLLRYGKFNNKQLTLKKLALFKQQGAVCGVDELSTAVINSCTDDPEIVAHLITEHLQGDIPQLLNTKNSAGTTALQLAKKYSLDAIQRVLIEKGAKAQANEDTEQKTSIVNVIHQFGLNHVNYTEEQIKARINQAYETWPHIGKNAKDPANGNTPYIQTAYYGNLPAAAALFSFNRTVGIELTNNNSDTALTLSVAHEDKSEEKPSELLQERRKFIEFALLRELELASSSLFSSNSLSYESIKQCALKASRFGNLYFLQNFLPNHLPKNDQKKLTDLCRFGLSVAIAYNQLATFKFWMKFRNDNGLALLDSLMNDAAYYRRYEMAADLHAAKVGVNYIASSLSSDFYSPVYTSCPLAFITKGYSEKKISNTEILQWIELLKQTTSITLQMVIDIIKAPADDPEVLSKFLEVYKYNLNAEILKANDYWTPLMYAADLGNVKTLNYLLDNKIVDADNSRNNFSEALVCAIKGRHFSCVVKLQQHGETLNNKQQHWEHVAKNIDVDHLATIIRWDKNDDPLFLDFLFKHCPQLKSCFLKRAWSYGDRTLIHIAADLQHFKTVCFLIQQGASILQKTFLGTVSSPALVAAVKQRNREFFNTVRTNKNAATEAATFSPGNELLIEAIENSQDDIALVKNLIELFKFDLNQPVNGRTPLMCAAEKGYLKTMTYLISQGAQINLINREGREYSPALWSAASLKENKENNAANNNESKESKDKICAVKLLMASHAADTEVKHESKADPDPRAEQYIRAKKLIRQNHFNPNLGEETTGAGIEGMTETGVTGSTGDKQPESLAAIIEAMNLEDLQDLYNYFQYTVQEPKLRELLKAKSKAIKFSLYPFNMALVTQSAEEAKISEEVLQEHLRLADLDRALQLYNSDKSSDRLKLIKTVILKASYSKTISDCLTFSVQQRDVNLLNCFLSTFRQCISSGKMLGQIDINAVVRTKGEDLSYLEWAAKNNDPAMVAFLLQQPGIQIDLSRALAIAMTYNSSRVAALLIMNGAHVTQALLNQQQQGAARFHRSTSYVRFILSIQQEGMKTRGEVINAIIQCLQAEEHEQLYRYFHGSVWQPLLDLQFPALKEKYSTGVVVNAQQVLADAPALEGSVVVDVAASELASRNESSAEGQSAEHKTDEPVPQRSSSSSSNAPAGGIALHDDDGEQEGAPKMQEQKEGGGQLPDRKPVVAAHVAPVVVVPEKPVVAATLSANSENKVTPVSISSVAAELSEASQAMPKDVSSEPKNESKHQVDATSPALTDSTEKRSPISSATPNTVFFAPSSASSAAARPDVQTMANQNYVANLRSYIDEFMGNVTYHLYNNNVEQLRIFAVYALAIRGYLQKFNAANFERYNIYLAGVESTVEQIDAKLGASVAVEAPRLNI